MFVDIMRGDAADPAVVVSVLKQPAPGNRGQIGKGCGQRRRPQRTGDVLAALAAKRQMDALSLDAHVPFEQRRGASAAARMNAVFMADADVRAVDQRDDGGECTQAAGARLAQVAGDATADLRQCGGEHAQPLELVRFTHIVP